MAETSEVKAATNAKPIPKDALKVKPSEKPGKELTPEEQADFDKRYEELKKNGFLE
jgi:hypothetical protein